MKLIELRRKIMEYKVKLPKSAEASDGWNSAKDLPPASKELYVVVQTLEDGERIRNAAYWQQDANGEWGWNKPDITHWMKWPEMPK